MKRLDVNVPMMMHCGHDGVCRGTKSGAGDAC